MEENVIQIKSGITINVNVSVKNIIYMEKIYIWNPAMCTCKNGKYLINIMDDSVIICDEIVDTEAKTIPTNFDEKK